MSKPHKQKSAAERLDEARDALNAIDPGVGRTDWIKIAAAAKAAGISEDEFVRWSSQAGNFDGEKSCRNDWRALKADSARGGRAITADTLFRYAYDAGWKPRNDDRNSWTPPTPRQMTRTPSRPRNTGTPDPAIELADDEKASAAENRKKIDRIIASSIQAYPDHPYLARKQIGAEGLLEIDMKDLKAILKYVPKWGKEKKPLESGRILVVPLHKGDGKPACLEFIDYEGHKSIMAGVGRAGTMWTPEPITGSPRIIYVAEGVATGYTGWMCTGELVATAGAKNNLRNVCQTLRNLYPGAKIIVLADLGAASEDDAREAAESVWGHSIAPNPEMLPEGGSDFNDMAIHAGEAEVTHWILRHSTHPDRPTMMGARERIKIDYVLPGLEAGTLGLIVGAGAVGKTFFALELAMSIALGRSIPRLDDAFWVPGQRGKTALVLGEDSFNQLNNRMYDIASYFSFSREDCMELDESMEVNSFVGRDMQLITTGRDGITETAFVNHMMHICTGRRLVFIDPMARLHDADENDNTAITKLFLVLSRIARLTNCSIILLHHFGKGDREGANAARGASAISTSARWQMNISHPTKEEREQYQMDEAVARLLIKCTGVKMNYGPQSDSFWLRRDVGGVLVHTDPEVAVSIGANPPPSTWTRSKPSTQSTSQGSSRRRQPSFVRVENSSENED